MAPFEQYTVLLTPRICGAWLVAGDGQLLGKVSGNRFSPDSILNISGNYGSEGSATSVWNQFGRYGSDGGPLSAFNDVAISPPKVVKGDEVLGFLTTSSRPALRVHPLLLKEWLSNGNCTFV
ncbi:MAG: hypothetical protein HY685_05065 [Chloroflexi bacterium]|nr:hypothetical protein [Chloroflexota bacterium]